jgi:spermidine synthase
LLFLSGFGSLGAQVAWGKLFAGTLGHEVASVLAVVTAVMAGLSLGGVAWRPGLWGLSPLRTAALLEGLIGAGTVASAYLAPSLGLAASRWIGTDPSPAWHWFVAFLVPGLALLPMTTAMGATLPVMEHLVREQTRDDRQIGHVYFLNTLGAMAGCLGIAFLAMPSLGLRGATLLCGSANILCGLLFLGRAPISAPVERPSPRRSPHPGGLSRRRLLGSLLLTGFLGIGFEVAGIRALSLVFENTVFSFASALGMYLLGTALGATAYHRWGRGRHPVDLLSWLLACVALGEMISASTMPYSRAWFDSVLSSARGAAWGIPAAEFALCAVMFLLPAVAMGACFSHLTALARSGDRGIGPAVGWNYLGGAGAGLGVGVWLLPAAGFKWTFLVLAGCTLAATPSLRSWSWSGAVAILAGLRVALLPDDLRLVEVPAGSRLVETRVGAMATVSVVSDAGDRRALRVNNRFQMGGTAAVVAQRRQAHIPLLLHPAPRTALFLGPGTGITLGAATLHPGLRVDAVELIPEVIECMPRFAPENRSPATNPAVHLHVSDARRFVQVTPNRYDVIVADLFHPARDGAGFLYTREHFQAVRNRLEPGGLFCQWLPVHQLDDASWWLIVRTFQAVFSHTEVWMLHYNIDIPVLGLVGRAEPLREEAAGMVERRLAQVATGELRSAGIMNAVQVLGGWVSGPRTVASQAPPGPLNTDDFPRVIFETPWIPVREGGDAAGGPFLGILDRLRPPAGAVPGVSPLVASFMSARDQYLHGLAREAAGDLPGAMELYLGSAAGSLHFTSGYARMVGIIQVMAEGDRSRARQLYDRLLAAQPDQPLGRQLLQRLFESPPGP